MKWLELSIDNDKKVKVHTLWKVFQASQTSSLECLYEIERSNHPSVPFSKSLVLIASRAAIFSQPSYWAFLDLLHVDCLCFVSQMLDWLLVFWKKKVNTTKLAKQCTSTKALEYFFLFFLQSSLCNSYQWNSKYHANGVKETACLYSLD